MSEIEDILEWLRELADAAKLSASYMESFHERHKSLASEVAHVRELVNRALEWRIAAELLRAAPEENTEKALSMLSTAEMNLAAAVDTLLDSTLGTPKKDNGSKP